MSIHCIAGMTIIRVLCITCSVCVMTDRWRAFDCTAHICCIQLIHLISETFGRGLRDVRVCASVWAVGGRLHRPLPSCAGHGVTSHRLRRNIQIWIWQGCALTITRVCLTHTHTLTHTCAFIRSWTPTHTHMSSIHVRLCLLMSSNIEAHQVAFYWIINEFAVRTHRWSYDTTSSSAYILVHIYNCCDWCHHANHPPSPWRRLKGGVKVTFLKGRSGFKCSFMFTQCWWSWKK